MLRNIFLLFFVLAIIACSTNKALVISENQETPTDSTEYEVIISESGYDSWVATNSKPIWYHSEDYYKNFNQLYVNEWNHRVRTRGYDIPYDYLIEYNPNINYGEEVEYNLYWYFKFIQHKYDIKLLVTENK